jgi:DNA replication protein DnaC
MVVPEVERAVCPSCGGRGWVVELDGGAGTARPCFCRQYDVVPRLIAAAGIPDRYRDCRLANFRVPAGERHAQRLQARAVAQRYSNDFLDPRGGFTHGGLLFMGPPGVGKTHLAVGVLVEVIERYSVHGRFVELNSFFNQMMSTFGQAGAESQAVLAPLMEVELLVLDELGTQQPTPWIRDVLYLVINTRYTRRLPTLFTTNYRLPAASASAAPEKGKSLDRGRDPDPTWDEAAALGTRLPSMLVSRLYEMAQLVPLTDVPDFRRDQSAQKARRK